MNLFDTISAQIKEAMLARDKVRLETLRGIKKEFLEARTAKGSDGNLSDEQAIKILTKMAKQRRETAQIYDEQNRPELRDGEIAEAEIIETYLPRQLSDDDLAEALRAIIAETGATSPHEMGKVMGVATKRLAGRADGSRISAMTRQLLS